MAREIQAYQSLEQDRPSRPCGAQEYEQASRCAAIRHHVEDSTELGGLVVFSGGDPVEGIEET